MIDYYSSYPEACILKEITSREVITALTNIFARFGYPEELVSDNGKQFISAEFETYLVVFNTFACLRITRVAMEN